MKSTPSTKSRNGSQQRQASKQGKETSVEDEVSSSIHGPNTQKRPHERSEEEEPVPALFFKRLAGK